MGDCCVGYGGSALDHLEIQVVLKAHGNKRDSPRLNDLGDLFSRRIDKLTVVGFLDVMLKWVLIGPIDNEIVSAAPLELYTLFMVFDRSWVVY
jgi:hypothetical protein